MRKRYPIIEGAYSMPIDDEKHRNFLKSLHWSQEKIVSDQQKGIEYPDLQKPCSEDATVIDLIPPDKITLGKETPPLETIINQRQSRRRYLEKPLTLEELSYLLWNTQGVKQIVRGGYCTKRTVPSAGARHPFELYLVLNRVDGLTAGIYRYLALDHKLCLSEKATSDLLERTVEACMGQKFVGTAAVVFILTVIPYRTEWRYTSRPSKIIALDAGHVFQNLYLSVESINAGTCSIGAYNQEKMDDLLGLDGQDHFTIYVASIGKV